MGKQMLANAASNSASTLLSGLNNKGHAEGTTQAAVANGTIIVRDQNRQTQDVSALSRDTEHANDSISAIFDKEKEQKRLQTAQLAGEISGQMTNIVTTMGDIKGLEKAQSAKNAETLPAGATEKRRGEWLEKMRDSPEYQAEMKQWGIGSTSQKVAQTVGSILTGLVTGNAGQAVAGGLNPWAAQLIKKETTDASGNVDVATNAMAYAVWGAVSSQMSGGSAAAGAAGAFSGELATRYIAEKYWGADTPEKIAALGQEDREQLSLLSLLGTLAAGLAGGMAGNSSAAATSGAIAGKNAVENNFLSVTSSDKLDKAIEKIKQGDKSLAAANELIKLENADKRSDALVSNFTKDPSQMNSTERAELAGYLRVYASEMEKEYGPAVSQELVKGLLSGQDYIKRNPDSEAMSKAQSIMNTWGYHKSNASIGDAPLIFGSSVLGTTIREGMALNAAIGVGVNAGVQLSGNDPFSYVDVIMAGVTAAATTGKGILPSAGINMGGAAIGSGVKGENPVNSVAGAAAGTVVGGIGGEIIKGAASKLGKDSISDLTGAVLGGYISEKTGNAAKDYLDEKDDANAKK
ncbi:VENN motif pre-toxin domain-containing protein [Pantoea vagans]|uniref:VENN motif pre-toxin domain-containing protein n=1 Tax=Pantoea vagans TaxID=470934 RepID=UPI00289A2DBC|nr:VENN motif pre-toxin domain-containing protein [Pantoea vagans]